MLIRPPVVREMRQSLWAKMIASPGDSPRAPVVDQHVATGAEVRLARLRDLGELRASGVLTEDEFLAEKAKILG